MGKWCIPLRAESIYMYLSSDVSGHILSHMFLKAYDADHGWPLAPSKSARAHTHVNDGSLSAEMKALILGLYALIVTHPYVIPFINRPPSFVFWFFLFQLLHGYLILESNPRTNNLQFAVVLLIMAVLKRTGLCRT